MELPHTVEKPEMAQLGRGLTVTVKATPVLLQPVPEFFTVKVPL